MLRSLLGGCIIQHYCATSSLVHDCRLVTILHPAGSYSCSDLHERAVQSPHDGSCTGKDTTASKLCDAASMFIFFNTSVIKGFPLATESVPCFACVQLILDLPLVPQVSFLLCNAAVNLVMVHAVTAHSLLAVSLMVCEPALLLDCQVHCTCPCRDANASLLAANWTPSMTGRC